MGAHTSRLYGVPQWSALVTFQKQTHFSMNELKNLHNMFMELAAKTPNKHLLSRSEFEEAVSSVFVLKDTEKRKEFLDLLFKEFDVNGDGLINFKEYISGLSVFGRGTFKERAMLSFHIFDIQGNDVITQEEMIAVLTSVSRSVQLANSEDRTTLPKEVEAEIRAYVAETFRKYDKSNTGVLSFEEYYEAVVNQPELIDFCQHQIQNSPLPEHTAAEAEAEGTENHAILTSGPV
eukprot:GCRY01002085.1.p1 GENE.GCRY01002085.1~~GCRY01002085.1.p1  ORF type:complete len:273 (+),score=36.70 GCRY01002085.1:118-819(+)